MKTSKWIILLLLPLFCQCTDDKMDNNEYGLSISQGACFPEVSDRYVYPIVPGMEEWRWDYNIENPIEKFGQLPDNVLKSISTPGLIDALIHAPFFTGFYVLSSNPSALKWRGHYQSFNSAKELFQRKDAGNALVAYYKLVTLACMESAPFGGVREYERLMGLEFLFTKQEILDTMGHEKKKEAVAAILENREQYPDNTNCVFPIVFIMLSDEYGPIVNYSRDHAVEFQPVLKGYLHSLEQVDLFISYAKDFVNAQK